MRLPRSLTARLVVTTVALVAAVAVLIGVATTLAMSDYLHDELDREVVASADRADGRPGRPGPLGGVPEVGNQRPGTLVAFLDLDRGFVLSEQRGEGEVLGSAALSALADVPSDGEVHEVDVSEHGTYRVVAHEGGGVVTGLPTSGVDEALTSLVRWEIALGLAAVLAAAVAGTLVVRRQLRSLTEVAATAHAVAELPLAKGEIGVTERVPEHLTDPRTETGQVGLALNTLLVHVETSLDARHRSEQQVRQFLADASHELRTPLTTIAGYAELARSRQDRETTQAALARIQDESRRMTALVADLLLLARLDAGRPLASETVDLARLAVEAADDARVVAPGHRWRVDAPSGGEPVEMQGDEERLRQVMTNLVTNARKYTPGGTTVTIRVRPDGFEVHDDGPGIPPALLDTAFERFTRADPARQRADGVGLGLALVKAIVSAHGGDVTLTSEPGNTRIRVRIRSRRENARY